MSRLSPDDARRSGSARGRGAVPFGIALVLAAVSLVLRWQRSRRGRRTASGAPAPYRRARAPRKGRARWRVRLGAAAAVLLLAWAVALLLVLRYSLSAPRAPEAILGVAAPAGAPAVGPTPPAAAAQPVVPPAEARAVDGTVLFTPESAVLSPATRRRLDALLPVLRGRPRVQVIIEGHCALFGTAQGRAVLSLARARAVERYLLADGWNPEVSPRVEGAGGLRPVSRDPARQYLNRRVEVRIAGE